MIDRSISKRVQANRLYAIQRYYIKIGKGELVQAIQRQREALYNTPILPEVQQNCIAHCGSWHIVTAIPMTLECCGTVILQMTE